MSDVIELSYNVDGDDFVSCGKASEDVKRTLKSIGIPSEVIRKVAIAMYEGNGRGNGTNNTLHSICNGRGNGTNNTCNSG